MVESQPGLTSSMVPLEMGLRFSGIAVRHTLYRVRMYRVGGGSRHRARMVAAAQPLGGQLPRRFAPTTYAIGVMNNSG